MRLHQITGGIPVVINNEEQGFISEHGDFVSMDFLDERHSIVANNLVRKGVYNITKDGRYLSRIDNADE
jgi:hypothetical protein